MEMTVQEIDHQVKLVKDAGCKKAELNQDTYNAVAATLTGDLPFGGLHTVYDVFGVSLLIKPDVPDGELRPVQWYES